MTESRSTPLLFPRPRLVERLDTATRHSHELTSLEDRALPAQGFSLQVDGDGATLRFADDAGFRYGAQTVAQLRDPDGTLPTVSLSDHPDFATRAFMLDVSRDRVPTRATLQRLVAVLDTCRYNQLQLYVEHTFAYKDHEAVWADASPLDADDLRWLDGRCAEVGIDLVANQNCFGHFAPWLALDDYRDRAECPGGFEIYPGIHLPATVLEPTEANAEFVLALVREQAAALRSTTVNVGCDETFELGLGASRDRVETEGRAAVYLEHLHRIVDPLVAEGRTVQFWADIVAHHPDHLHEVPSEGTIALVWNYDGPGAPILDLPEFAHELLESLGIDVNGETSFASRLRPFADAGLTFWVAPGTSSWNSLVGRIDNAYANLADAAEGGLGAGAAGYLVTDWGDGGHHQPLTVSFPPIAYGGAVAWGLEANRDLDVAEVVDNLLLGSPGSGIGGILERIGRVAGRTGLRTRNSSPIFSALIPDSLAFEGNGEPDPVSLAEVLATLDTAAAELGAIEPGDGFGAELIEELATAVALAHFGAETLAMRAGIDGPKREGRAATLDSLIERYRAAWLTTSRPGGLTRSAGHLERTRDALRS